MLRDLSIPPNSTEQVERTIRKTIKDLTTLSAKLTFLTVIECISPKQQNTHSFQGHTEHTDQGRPFFSPQKISTN